MKTPWRIAHNDKRVSIVSADGHVMTEVIPGQVGGVVPHKRVVEIAQMIIDGVNQLADRGWAR